MRVALVCMPFCAADRPSIQIGLLAAIVREHGFEADTHHLNLDLAALLPDAYDGLCSHTGHMTGEWLFGVAAFGEDAEADGSAYLEQFPEEVANAARGGKDAEFLLRLRRELLPAFVEACAEGVDWGAYDVVGFTSTFQQNVASLALARRIKTRFPAVRIVFGGANMEDEMGPEYARVFEFVDCVVVGEADRAFVSWLRAVAAGESGCGIAGIVCRDHAGQLICAGQAPPVQLLDPLPTPDYHEYFERVGRLQLTGHERVGRTVPFESSRGCWWGEKHHCTFCGLNGLGMGFRSKS
ncbi:RiPP maturation radical SAM C-methyltransferase, partial [Solirubrobacter ginsenosidimutans]|uniref:RiPP maturation radical SAM C-methyltransferase n=1 Tax=Solirubrobacter ginsenosidimutans TaxID=490573 RepID=UPI0022CE04AF